MCKFQTGFYISFFYRLHSFCGRILWGFFQIQWVTQYTFSSGTKLVAKIRGYRSKILKLQRWKEVNIWVKRYKFGLQKTLKCSFLSLFMYAFMNEWNWNIFSIFHGYSNLCKHITFCWNNRSHWTKMGFFAWLIVGVKYYSHISFLHTSGLFRSHQLEHFQ